MAATPSSSFPAGSPPSSSAAWAAQLLVAACDLPAAWQGRPQWRVLDSRFTDGAGFFATWQAWARDKRACAKLHVVALCDRAPERVALLRAMAAFPDLANQAATLDTHWFGLLPGFHRFELHGGRVLLTLCVGPLLATLRELQFVADSVYLHGAPAAAPQASGETTTSPSGWDKWAIKALSRLCRVGTGIAVTDAHAPLTALLQHAGFVLEPTPGSAVVAGQFRPRFTPSNSRSRWRRPPEPATQCIVVGAGLAGAAAAAALARRGWQITVLDAAAAPALGASSLPVGLFVPLPSRDDNHRARLARAGIRLILQASSRLLRAGEEWGWSGVAERVSDAATATPMLPRDWPAEGRDWSHAGLAKDTATPDLAPPAGTDDVVWHAAAGWIKPVALVRACLAQPGIVFRGNSTVASIGHDGDDGNWILRDAAGNTLARAPHIVLTAAGNTEHLCALAYAAADGSGTEKKMGLALVDGQVSWAMHDPRQSAMTAFPRVPVNGAGSLVAHVPCDDGGTAWFVGASYETQPNEDAEADAEDNAHRDNLARLARLQAPALQPARNAQREGQLHAWRGTRCTTPDRLPVAGPRDAARLPGVWVSAAMGSRGLTYAVLSAELIAAQLSGEPLPLPASLCKALAADRPALRRRSDHL